MDSIALDKYDAEYYANDNTDDIYDYYKSKNFNIDLNDNTISIRTKLIFTALHNKIEEFKNLVEEIREKSKNENIGDYYTFFGELLEKCSTGMNYNDELNLQIVKIIKIIHSLTPYLNITSDIIRKVCNVNNVYLLDYYLNYYGYDYLKKLELNVIFNYLNQYGDTFDSAYWLHKLNVDNNLQLDFDYSIGIDITSLFQEFDKLKSIFSEKNQYNNPNAFNFKQAYITACTNGNLEIVKYLHNLTKNFLNNNEFFDEKFGPYIYIDGFKLAYENNIDICKWIYENDLSLLVKKLNLREMFLIGCSDELEKLKWLIENFNIEVNVDGFFKACKSCNLNVIDWFLKNNYVVDYIVLEEFEETLEFINMDNVEVLERLLIEIEKRNIKDKINIDMLDLYFTKHVSKNEIEFCKFIMKLNNKYWIDVKDNIIIGSNFNSNHKKIMNDDNYISINCEICMDDKKYFVFLECKHFFCRDCYLKLEKCPLCLNKIDGNINLYKI